MLKLDGYGGYSKEEIMDVLHARNSPRSVRFRYYVLDTNHNVKAELTKVESCKIDHAAFARIKRTATLALLEEYEPEYYVDGKPAPQKEIINYLSDRIQPVMEVKMHDGKWLSFPLGVFHPSTPSRQASLKEIKREIDLYDGLIVLSEDLISRRLTFSSGSNITDLVANIMRDAKITRINVTPSNETLPKDKDFDPGTPRLDIVNELLDMINYTPVWCDANGYFTTGPYRAPGDREVEYEYRDDELSIIYNGASEVLDLFGVANEWTLVRTNTEEPPLVSTKQNNNPNSPTSIPSRNRKITDFREVDEIASQSALNGLVERIAAEASQVYGRFICETALMPIHEYQDKVRIQYNKLGVADDFIETNWSMELKAGGRMEHEMRKVVHIDET